MAFQANQQVRELSIQQGNGGESSFDQHLAELKEFMQRENNRKPKHHIIDEEARLEEWIDAIQKNYAKREQNMKDETGRAKWEEFLKTESGQLLMVEEEKDDEVTRSNE